MHFVIPGLTRNPVFFWIPAFAGMTPFVAIIVAVYKKLRVKDYELISPNSELIIPNSEF